LETAIHHPTRESEVIKNIVDALPDRLRCQGRASFRNWADYETINVFVKLEGDPIQFFERICRFIAAIIIQSVGFLDPSRN
jgi:hypothetical protein